MIRLLLALAALAALPISASAQARTVVVLPQINGDAHVAAAARERAIQAVVEALGAEGLEVRTEVPEALRECGRGPCIPEVLRATESDLAARITIWARQGASTEAGELVVGLVTREEHSFEGSAHVEGPGEGAIGEAAIAAVHQAHARLIVGPGPFLLVHGTPFGATVYLDGEMAGGLPWNGRVEPGQHEVRVERQGFVTQTHTVQVADDVTAQEDLEVTLVSEGGGGGEGIAGWALPVGVGAIIAGLGVGVGVPAISAATTGCAEEVGGTCVTSNRLAVGPTIAWAIVGGAVALGGLTLVLIAATEDGGATVQARLSPTRLTLEGSF